MDRAKWLSFSWTGRLCHGHTKRGLGRSTNDGATSVELKTLGTTQENEDRYKDQGDTDTPTLGYEGAQMMGLRATGHELGTRSIKARNSGSWERPHKRIKTEMIIKETRWDDMRITRLMCQWLALNPLKGTKEVTSIHIVSWSTCIRIFWRIFP